MRHAWKVFIVSALIGVAVFASVSFAASKPRAASSATSATTRTAPSQQDRQRHRDELATALAEKLGLDKAKVTAALDAVKPDGQRRARPPAGRPGPDALAQALATKLGVDKAKVLDALKAVQKDRVEADVKAGRLTRAQADAILKCMDSPTSQGCGACGGPHGGPGGPGGPMGAPPAQGGSSNSTRSTSGSQQGVLL